MPLSRAFQKLTEGGLLIPLASKPLPQPIPPRFRMDLHCSYHQGPGHDTDHCTALRHAIQDLIDQGLVNLGQPSVTTNPLPAHSTHAVYPSLGDIHHMDLIEDDSIHMLSWDDGLLSRFYRMSGCFRPIHFMAEDDDSAGERSDCDSWWEDSSPPPPPPVGPFEGTTSHEEVRREDDEVLRQLQSTQASISIWIPSSSDNGSALNVCPLATAIALGFAPSDFGPSTQTVRAYDSTKREVMGTLMIDLQIGPATFSTLFQVLRIPTSFNLLLGRPWIHVAGAIPSSLHQKVKFIHDGQVITVRSTRDIFAARAKMLRLVIQGPSEFIATIDHDTTFGLGFIPHRGQLHHMAQEEGELLQLSDGAPDSSFPLTITPTSLDRASMLSLCFPEEITGDGVMVDSTKMIDGVVPHDEYRDEMDMMTVSQIIGIVQLQPVSAFDMFEVSTIEVFEGTQTLPVPELPEDDSSLFEGIVSPVEGASDLVDPPLSFDVLLGFVSALTIVKIGLPYLDERDKLIHLLRSYSDVLHGERGDSKQLGVGFISVVEYPKWLANVVLVPKRTAKLDHSMLSFMDGFSGYNQILMAPEDMEKTTFITEWGTYCYKVMPFGLKNAGTTYQRAATTLFHDMMHRDVEVYVDDMIVKSQGKADHLEALERFFERIRKFRLRLNPKKCTFGVTSGKLLGHMVSERGIEVDPDKIKAILDMPAPKTEKEIRGFLGRLQYISRFIARLTDVCEPIFRLLRKNQSTVWNDDCQLSFEKIKGSIDDSGKERAIYYLSKRMLEYEVKYVMIERLCLTVRWLVLLIEFDIQYVSQKSIKGSIVADHLASLPTSEDRPIDDDFLDEEFVAMTTYRDGVLLVSPQGDHIPRSVRLAFSDRHPATNNIVEYEACILGLETALELDIRQMEKQRSRMIYLGIMTFISFLDLAHTLRRSADGMLLLCLDRASADRVMREVHSGVCGPHMRGHMLARKIMRTSYFWLTMETDCCQFVQKCPECQIHGDLIHAPPSELHALTSPWPFSFILVAIDYFTKWVEAASYARLTSARVASFIRSHIICRYGVPHELISDRGVHFRAETNGAVEAANKNIKRILRKMVETSRDWSEKLPFALWAYRTSFRTSTGATPYSLVYGMEVVLPVETEMGSLRVALERDFETVGSGSI
ncbi:hypothetical protein AAG906_035658 [Vitis piasezkii]